MGDVPSDKATAASAPDATAAVLTPLSDARVLTALCSLNKLRGKVLATSAGAFFVLDTTAPTEVDYAARTISKFVKDQPILGMERRDGLITIHRWITGVKGESLSPGFALDQAPGAIANIMAGTETIDQFAATHPDKVHTADLGRMKAYREIRRLLKEAKLQQ